MQYPLVLNFKILAIAPQIFIRDANGSELMYVKQKLFKLKEDINVFSDRSQTTHLYSIKADRIIDFSPRYNFADPQGMSLGAVKRQGMRSLWKAHYDILAGDTPILHIREENPFVKFMDALFGEIPIIGMLSGYVFNPVYLVQRPGEMGQTVMRLTKRPSFLESNFTIEAVDPNLSEKEETLILLSVLTA
ncbi:MAG: hypothetical protein GWO38_14835, partial [Phycisphaerae bacterium]|nr:hypothetical protein [Phycisphaerae bacterium]NIX28862.1 hypothetical protein [Phycisphaerae bacterium]